jgi:hypothetical protein
MYSYFLFQSLFYITFYTKPGVKVIIKLRVLMKGKHRTSIESPATDGQRTREGLHKLSTKGSVLDVECS